MKLSIDGRLRTAVQAAFVTGLATASFSLVAQEPVPAPAPVEAQAPAAAPAAEPAPVAAEATPAPLETLAITPTATAA